MIIVRLVYSLQMICNRKSSGRDGDVNPTIPMTGSQGIYVNHISCILVVVDYKLYCLKMFFAKPREDLVDGCLTVNRETLETLESCVTRWIIFDSLVFVLRTARHVSLCCFYFVWQGAGVHNCVFCLQDMCIGQSLGSRRETELYDTHQSKIYTNIFQPCSTYYCFFYITSP